MPEFRIEIARVPVQIRCRFDETETFLRAYRTDREPAFCIEPTDADLAAMQAEFDRMNKADGIQPHPRSHRMIYYKSNR